MMNVTKHFRYRRGCRGLTVIEMLLAMAVLSAILLIAYPPVSSYIRAARIDRASRVVALDLEYAVTLAARQRRPIRVESDAAHGYRISSPRDSMVLQHRFLGSESEYAVQSVALEPTAVEIYPTGIASSPLTVSLALGDKNRAVTMSRAGHIRVIRQ